MNAHHGSKPLTVEPAFLHAIVLLLDLEVKERGYEGMVAKDPASPYVGGRTLKWLKVKQRDYRIEERGWDSRNKS
jgi:ATP-dependent DNA ligase